MTTTAHTAADQGPPVIPATIGEAAHTEWHVEPAPVLGGWDWFAVCGERRRDGHSETEREARTCAQTAVRVMKDDWR